MSKRTKKRNKQYQGADASSKQPTVHKYVAVKRSPAGEWWQEKKKLIKILTIVSVVVILLIIIMAEIISLLTNGI